MGQKTILMLLALAFLEGFALAQTTIPKRGFAVDWMIPRTSSNPVIDNFSRIELGIALPDSLEDQIDRFIENYTDQVVLNPFNPEDIDVEATFSRLESNGSWSVPKKTYGFFFEDFKRMTKSKDLHDWNWEKVKSKPRFRVRFTPDNIGKWRFFVKVRVKGKELVKLGEYEFSCAKSEKKGFIKLNSDQRYLQLGTEAFIPIGQNMSNPECYLEKDAQGKILRDPNDCANCPCAGKEEHCLRLNQMPAHPKIFTVYLDELAKLKSAGGNYLRMMNAPYTYEIEFEKTGNYYDRLHLAWELDQFFEITERLDLKVQFNLFSTLPLSSSQNEKNLWDWNADEGQDLGFCYRNDLNLKEPLEFLTSETAKKHFKNRLRYIISRWGYSTSIAVLELVNQLQNQFPGHEAEVYQWQAEMCRYIREDLDHTQHLLTVSTDFFYAESGFLPTDHSLKYQDLISKNLYSTPLYYAELAELHQKHLFHNKPLILSVIGNPETIENPSFKQVEWTKNLWISTFSGIASSGTNLNGAHEYDTWKQFQALSNFISSIDFNEFLSTQHHKRKDGMAELIALTDQKNQKSVGVIQNVSWNTYTAGNNGKVAVPSDNKLRNFSEIRPLSRKKGIWLTDLGGKTEYLINWYDPFTNEVIESTNARTNSRGKLLMEHPKLTKDLPFVAFKLSPKGKEFSTYKSTLILERKIEVKKNNTINEY